MVINNLTFHRARPSEYKNQDLVVQQTLVRYYNGNRDDR